MSTEPHCICPAVPWRGGGVGQTAVLILSGVDPVLIVCFVSFEMTNIDVTHQHVERNLVKQDANTRQPRLPEPEGIELERPQPHGILI